MANFNEFEKLYNRIPKEILNNVWFIKLRPFQKRPVEGSWLAINKHLDIYNIKKSMFNGFNIGVVALPSGLLIIDIDTDINGNLLSGKIATELVALDTFTVRTRSKGLHFYFLNNNILNTQNIRENGTIIGEIRSNISYVLTPGCCVCNYDQKYTVINDVPIKSLNPEYVDLFGLEKTSNLHSAKPTLNGKTGKLVSDEKKQELATSTKKVTDMRKKELLDIIGNGKI